MALGNTDKTAAKTPAAIEVEDDIDIDDLEIHEDAELSREAVTALHAKLVEERARVCDRLARHLGEVTADSDNLPDEMDIAARQADQAYLLRLADKEKKLLTQIDHALRKFSRGTYGICEGTGDPIAEKRLLLRPWTRYSIEYKEQLEKSKSKSRGYK